MGDKSMISHRVKRIAYKDALEVICNEMGWKLEHYGRGFAILDGSNTMINGLIGIGYKNVYFAVVKKLKSMNVDYPIINI
jgi:hypothetical protein